MEKITVDKIDCMHAKGDYIDGVILVRDYTTQLTKNGKEYVIGTLCAEKDVPFKAWGNSNAFDALTGSESLAGKVVCIKGTWDDYGDMYSIILDDVSLAESMGYSMMDFIPTKYATQAYENSLKQLIQSSVSEKGYTLVDKLLFSNEALMERFRYEFAAKSHHDNVKSGLLAHTYKVCNLSKVLINLYPSLLESEDSKDLLIIGALLHDIGKTVEMNVGVYTEFSFVTHRFFGVEFLDKDLIVNTYSLGWYYHLVAIMLQHHGKWGDPCKTVHSRLINLIDELDASVTLIQQKLDTRIEQKSIKVDDAYLDVYH